LLPEKAIVAMRRVLAELTGAAFTACLFAATALAADNAHSSIDQKNLLECASCGNSDVVREEEQIEQQQEQQQQTQIEQQAQDQVFNQNTDAASAKLYGARTTLPEDSLLENDSPYGNIYTSSSGSYVYQGQWLCCVTSIYYESGYQLNIYYGNSNGQRVITSSTLIDSYGNVVTTVNNGLPPGLDEQGMGTNTAGTGAGAVSGGGSGTSSSTGAGSTGNGGSSTAGNGGTSGADGGGSQ
jgi:transcription initiation factor TFIID subunit TAF12